MKKNTEHMASLFDTKGSRVFLSMENSRSQSSTDSLVNRKRDELEGDDVLVIISYKVLNIRIMPQQQNLSFSQ
jgi:hypothetical protein